MSPETPDRNISMELARATEAAALGAVPWTGRGDKNGADGGAVDAMRTMLNTIDIDGVVVIGEGEKDEAPMLFNSERVGTGIGPRVDIAVDPIDGTTLLSLGRANAVSVIAAAPRGAMYNPHDIFYMEKIAVGPEAKGKIDLSAPVRWNLEQVAKARGIPLSEVTVTLLDRPRNDGIVADIRDAGARIISITDGDVAGAVMAGHGRHRRGHAPRHRRLPRGASPPPAPSRPSTATCSAASGPATPPTATSPPSAAST